MYVYIYKLHLSKKFYREVYSSVERFFQIYFDTAYTDFYSRPKSAAPIKVFPGVEHQNSASRNTSVFMYIQLGKRFGWKWL